MARHGPRGAQGLGEIGWDGDAVDGADLRDDPGSDLDRRLVWRANKSAPLGEERIARVVEERERDRRALSIRLVLLPRKVDVPPGGENNSVEEAAAAPNIKGIKRVSRGNVFFPSSI